MGGPTTGGYERAEGWVRPDCVTGTRVLVGKRGGGGSKYTYREMLQFWQT